MSAGRFRIGVISDTHNFLDPRVHDLFEGVDHILHSGDICDSRIIEELQTIAPVTAVLGNNDLGLSYQETEVVTLVARKFLIHHIVQPRHLAEPLRQRIEREQPAVVVFGHSHQPFAETIGGILYLNPGYSGRPKFRLERCVAVLTCKGEKLTPEFLKL